MGALLRASFPRESPTAAGRVSRLMPEPGGPHPRSAEVAPVQRPCAGIVLVRHVATQWNVEGRFLSRTDLAPAPGTLDRPAFPFGVDAVWCSPMLRARATAEMFFPGRVMCIDSALREVDFGRWEGRMGAEIAASEPAEWSARRASPATFCPPGGERVADAALRLAGLVADLRAARGLRAVVGHRTCLGVLERLLRELPIDDPGVAGLEPGGWRILQQPSD
jgi:broad specificity phosphatase PhoE